jgi:MFS-type transporter involved in bile tolerance (Atg22 family)
MRKTMIITACFALGCFLVVVSLPLGSASIRRAGATLVLIPLAGAVLFGALRDAIQRDGGSVAANAFLGLIILSVIAYAVLKVRKGLATSGQPKRIATKRPYLHQRGRDVMSFIKEQLDRDE